MGRHGSMVEYTAYINSLFTFIGILYAAHLVACGWYFVSTLHEQSWIMKNEHQVCTPPPSPPLSASLSRARMRGACVRAI